MRELERAADDDGAAVLTGVCQAGQRTPLAAVRTALEGYLDEVAQRPGRSGEAALARVRRAAEGIEPLLGGLSTSLDAMLGLDDGAPRRGGEQLVAAAAGLLSALARLEGGLLVTFDHAHHLDGHSRRVVQALLDDAASAPMLIAGTTVPSEDLEDAKARQAAATLAAEASVLDLAALDDDAVAERLAAQLGGARVPDELVEHVLARSGGWPAAIADYTRALIEGGALRPSWGTWTLERAALEGLELPATVLGLALERLRNLDSATRRVLTAAAVQGVTFDLGVLERTLAESPAGVRRAVAAAVDARLIESRRRGQATFAHESLREEILAAGDPDEVAGWHAAAAEALSERDAGSSEAIYRIAGHRLAAGARSDPVASYEACHAAGRLATAEHASEQATELFARAAEAAERAGLSPPVAFLHDRAVALLQAGDLDGARRQIGLALERERDRLGRARLHETAARIASAGLDSETALAHARRGADQLDRAWPRSRVVFMLGSLTRLLGGIIARVLPTRAGDGPRHERLIAEAALIDAAVKAAGVGMHGDLLTGFTLRNVWVTSRLGPSRHRAASTAQLGFVAKVTGVWPLGERLADRAEGEAAEHGDARDVAAARWMRGMIDAWQRSDETGLVETLEQHGRWLSTVDYAQATSVLVTVLNARGYSRQAERWLAAGHRRLATAPGTPHGHALALPGCSTHAYLGRAHEASTALAEARQALTEVADVREHRVYAIWTELIVASEQDDLGARFDEAAEAYRAEGLAPRNPPAGLVAITLAFGRLAQARAASGQQRHQRLTQADEALTALRRAGRRDDLRAAYHLGDAERSRLRAQTRRAWQALARARQLLRRFDSPRLTFGATVLEARLLEDAGQRHASERAARSGAQLAADAGWPHHARRVRETFDLTDVTPPDAATHASPSTTSTSSASARDRRRLNALRAVAAAAATTDPDELIHVALDATLELLAAERAFLFLADDNTDALRPTLGRLADGQPLTEITGYGASLVDRVHATGQPLVVTGSEEGAALGSHSTVLHGLRSILVAPLRLQDRRLGVLYLDSRIAKGVFTDDDADLLAGITNDIAAALETARASRLELAVHTARQQRDLAETLRGSMVELNAILDPEAILHQALQTMSRHLPGERACLIRNDGGQPALAGLLTRGVPTTRPEDNPLRPDDPRTEQLLTASEPILGNAQRRLPDALDTALDRPASWLAVPLTSRDRTIGVITLGSDEPGDYDEAAARIAAALAEQAAVAHDNARLFTEVQSLATTDPLTGVANRRAFLQQAEDAIQLAPRPDEPAVALMIDIDHFKRVNDRYGHAIGDTVLQDVAERLATHLRGCDVLGRLGGEEFAALITAAPDATAAAERLRAAVAAAPIPTAAGPIEVTISLGGAILTPGDNLDSILARADDALYDAKRNGRNKTTIGHTP